MKYDRILTERVRAFLTTPSEGRDHLIDFIRKNADKRERSVALCFRGNAATLYYRCHQLLRIRDSVGGLVGEFDFRHARFTQNYREILGEMKEELHVDISRFSDLPSWRDRNFVTLPLEGATGPQLERLLAIYRALIDDFLDPEKTCHAFDEPKTKRKKALGVEKDRQQEVYAARFLQENFFYYDLEFSQREAAKNGVHGRFDLLGLRREGNFYTLLLTELKCTREALRGRSGIEEHERDYVRYLQSPLIETRKREASEAARLLFGIFQRPIPKGLTPENIKEVKVRFVFSDDVIDAGRAYRPKSGFIEKARFSPSSGEEPLL